MLQVFRYKVFTFFFIFVCHSVAFAQKVTPRSAGIPFGILTTGKYNAITDVEGVKVGHFTKIEGGNIRTGVTAIIPHNGNIYREKVPAAIYIGNGYGKLAGYSQVKELGNIETPILLTNTLNIASCLDALIDYTLTFDENKNIRSVNGIVGETNDGSLNDIQGRHIKPKDGLQALLDANSGPVQEGNVGAGTGTICFGFKGGIGTASRKIPEQVGGYTLGVLVQTNFGGVLQINGVPVGQELGQYKFKDLGLPYKDDGSCMIVIATDAPLTSRNLERLAKRSMLGLGRTGGIQDHGSGDYAIAFSTAQSVRVGYVEGATRTTEELKDENLGILFEAVIEATEEAIINSLFAAKTMTGQNGLTIKELPVDEVLKIMKTKK